MNYREIEDRDNERLRDLIRYNLKSNHLDIPGTVYYDPELGRLSEYYLADPGKRYYCVLTDEKDQLVGGIGLAEFESIEDCAELQKLYLADEMKGRGLSYNLVQLIEDKARRLGYERMYLETHSNLQTAIHVYEKCGYRQIPRPETVIHGSMNQLFLKEL